MNKILVVDSSLTSAELISKYLISAGYEVLIANDGQTALTKVKIFKPSVVILDLSLPKISGFDICKTLKQDFDTKYVQILSMSSTYSKEIRARAFQVGADEYLEKSFDKETLLVKVQSLFRISMLTSQLKENFAKIEEQNKLLETQLLMANRIQKALIKDINMVAGDVLFKSAYLPAMEVGGDLYDIVKISPDKISLFMADVSGHGISAALLTSMLKSQFRTHALNNHEPDKLLYSMNNAFCDVFKDTDANVYTCAFSAVFDLTNKRITYANAGHSLPLLAKHKTGEVCEITSSGVPLGILENNYYVKKHIDYHEGDLILFFTDGLCDSHYKDEPEEFLIRIKDLLSEIVSSPRKTISPDEVIQLIVNQFVDPKQGENYRSDDISLIVINILESEL